MSEDIEIGEQQQRADYVGKTGKARKKPGPKPKARFDSKDVKPLDGFGAPFDVQLTPGWDAFWVSALDMGRFRARPWQVVCWGDPRLVSYLGSAEGKKGEPVTCGLGSELTLHVMKTEDAVLMRARDGAKLRHQKIMKSERLAAENSRAGGERGFIRSTERDITI